MTNVIGQAIETTEQAKVIGDVLKIGATGKPMVVIVSGLITAGILIGVSYGAKQIKAKDISPKKLIKKKEEPTVENVENEEL